jgi:catechol 2,3-dioxygenase-like lactoylglutathione lyase family enzyme
MLYILAFSTSNYDAMLAFFSDFGFQIIEERGDQLTPYFESGRGARIKMNDLEFQLEESDDKLAKARFNLALLETTGDEIDRIVALGYKCKIEAGPYGKTFTFSSPDGGVIVL